MPSTFVSFTLFKGEYQVRLLAIRYQSVILEIQQEGSFDSSTRKPALLVSHISFSLLFLIS